MRKERLIPVFLFCLLSGSLFLSLSKTRAALAVPAKKATRPAIITLDINGKKFELSSDKTATWVTERPTLEIASEYRNEIEIDDFCTYQKMLVCKLLFDSRNHFHIKKISNSGIDNEAIQGYLDELAIEANQVAEDAKFKLENGKVSAFSLGQKGFELDKEGSLKIFADYLKNKSQETALALPFKEIEPQVLNQSVDNLGITDLLGEGTSNFRGSPKNRIFNIKVATERFNGVLIKPGEEFSFVKTLGEVDEEHGYLPELVIKQDKTEPEFGGGICQVSTTAFRAAIYSGLEITARRNHAYPVSYYNPQGMDSTVYIPRPDLRFINDTPGYILIQARIEGTQLIFDFYGKSDGRKTNVIGPTVLEKNPDGSMKTTFTQEVLDKDGNKVRSDVFKSAYDSPDKYPHPGETLTKKPKDWSKKQWEQYKKDHNLR